MRKVDHDLTLIAFVSNENGTLSVRDIVETSWHHASYFARRWMKDGEIVAIGTRRPGETDYRMHPQGMTLFLFARRLTERPNVTILVV